MIELKMDESSMGNEDNKEDKTLGHIQLVAPNSRFH